MKKIVAGLFLVALSFNTFATTFYTEPVDSTFQEPRALNAVQIVEQRVLRRSELENDILMSKMKIAAFQVEIAKEELNIATAKAANRKLDAEAEAMAEQFKKEVQVQVEKKP